MSSLEGFIVETGTFAVHGFGSLFVPFYQPDMVLILSPSKTPRPGQRVIVRDGEAFRCVEWPQEETPAGELPAGEVFGVVKGYIQDETGD